MGTYTLPYVKYSQWELAAWLRELKPRLCNNLEGCDGEGGGKEL